MALSEGNRRTEGLVEQGSDCSTWPSVKAKGGLRKLPPDEFRVLLSSTNIVVLF
jgi:hypothetical protein